MTFTKSQIQVGKFTTRVAKKTHWWAQLVTMTAMTEAEAVPVREAQRCLERLDDSRSCLRFHDHAIDHHIDVVARSASELDLRIELAQLAVDAGSDEALLLELFAEEERSVAARASSQLAWGGRPCSPLSVKK